MSNAVRFDSLLVRDLAGELDERLSKRRIRAAHFDRDGRRIHLRFRDLSFMWDLDPGRGGVARGPAVREPGNVRMARGSRIVRVHAPPDERMVEFVIDPGDAPASATRRIVVELMTNRWNAFALAADRRVAAILRSGATAARSMTPGDIYRPPRLSVRLGARSPVTLDDWLRLLLPSPPRERRRRVLEALAYTSPINVDAILGESARSADGQALRDAHERYCRVLTATPREPCLIDPEGAAQPYGMIVASDAEPQASLLEAFEAALLRRGRAAPPGPGAVREEASDRIAGRIRQADRRLAQLRRELDGAPHDAASSRRLADLLMSQLGRVPRGAAGIDLEDYDGAIVHVPLDPALSPAQNADRLYGVARKRDRAARELPGLVERYVREREALTELRDRIGAGEATDAELAAALATRTRRSKDRARAEPPSLPYRRYRTRGGLEVRVGRGSAANDALTARHSNPSDIWLHARDAAGAHVILRWTDRDANPPARDIADAAVLAALHSRARTSATVPVDWTRRRYVRKPRKSPPGRVVIERAKTVFVEPDAKLEESLRWDPMDDLVDDA